MAPSAKVPGCVVVIKIIVLRKRAWFLSSFISKLTCNCLCNEAPHFSMSSLLRLPYCLIYKCPSDVCSACLPVPACCCRGQQQWAGSRSVLTPALSAASALSVSTGSVCTKTCIKVATATSVVTVARASREVQTCAATW